MNLTRIHEELCEYLRYRLQPLLELRRDQLAAAGRTEEHEKASIACRALDDAYWRALDTLFGWEDDTLGFFLQQVTWAAGEAARALRTVQDVGAHARERMTSLARPSGAGCGGQAELAELVGSEIDKILLAFTDPDEVLRRVRNANRVVFHRAYTQELESDPLDDGEQTAAGETAEDAASEGPGESAGGDAVGDAGEVSPR